MNSLELAYTVTVLRRLTESADNYIDEGSWLEHLLADVKDAKALLRAYDKRLEQQARKEGIV